MNKWIKWWTDQTERIESVDKETDRCMIRKTK